MLFQLAVGVTIGLLVAWVYCLIWKVRYTRAIREDAVRRSQTTCASSAAPWTW